MTATISLAGEVRLDCLQGFDGAATDDLPLESVNFWKMDFALCVR